MRVVALLVVAIAVSLAQPRAAEAQYPCDEMCVHFTNGSGQHLGYGCFAGSEGDGCEATYDMCSLNTGGCGSTEEEDAAELAMGAGALAQLFTRGFAQTAGGSLFYAVVPCKSGSGALFLPAAMVSEEVDVAAVLGEASVPWGSEQVARDAPILRDQAGR